MSVMYMWLLAAVLCMAAEAMGVTGIGLLFAGLGALVVGTLIHYGNIAETDIVYQFIAFFIATAFWAAILWKPMQRFRLRGGSKGYSNIVGETAFVGSKPITRQGGEVTWSGTIMNAQIAADAGVERIEAGSQVTIVEISGTTLVVKPK